MPFAIACSLKLAIAVIFSHEEHVARAQAIEHGFDHSLMHGLVAAINADIRGTAQLRMVQPDVVKWKPPFVFATGLSRVDGLGSKRATRPAAYLDRSKMNPRQVLRAALQDVIDDNESSMVLRTYGESLLTIVLPHIRQTWRDSFVELLRVVSIVNGRLRASYKPREGILLVRDRAV
jgi:hypothetical protein